ncbi:TPA: HpaII family restriction endonuclease [Streptococcus pyogenes]|uniref:HpaII family restriction endonuclease n=1 Tax=Streptococcus pyogenes TaxID=1314 RepID=UPI000A1F87A7|nr:HpaII family restriction endonuclease [Streptococcus pyogenes]HER4683897.1 HpaII family restriction endonuclease [Streptococcus pyogenes NGAS358]HER4694401.1 HpaII family restriction endonuclease [Streptococcus pyogenes NGAS367]OUI72255.1 hypothetical protein B7R60_08185 [Streptococcus pyogenes]VGT69912.1 HpaII restriction endonuclease [Streptococcus pyogenes]VHB08055.1 HpaII restriction endonuclease [Streptococcus pyogenes]
MPNKVNKGEWAELYVFLKALSEGKIYAADADLNKIPDLFYMILSAIKIENNVQKEYSRDEESGNIVLIEDNHEVLAVSISEFTKYAEHVIDSIQKGKGTFEIPIVEPFLKKINITKIKQNSDSKKDIVFKIHDDFTGAEPTIGFSVKSYVGSKPTLLNASGATKVTFDIEGKILQEFIKEINSIDSRDKIKDRIQRLDENGNSLIFREATNSIFERNLQMIDYRLPEILGKLFMFSYFVKGKSIPQVVEYFCEKESEDIKLIEYKIKDLLVAVALGMEPNSPWDGMEDANGGYIVVKDTGEILCYHIYDRNKLREYLYRNTKFDSPSSSRTGAGLIIESHGAFQFGLTIQIRF